MEIVSLFLSEAYEDVHAVSLSPGILEELMSDVTCVLRAIVLVKFPLFLVLRDLFGLRI